MMRVVVYSGPFFPNMGGLERNTLTLCCALTDLGHEVTLLTETPAEDADDYPFRVIRSRSIQTFYREVHGADFVITNGGNVPLRVATVAYLQGIPYGAIYHGFRGFEDESEEWGGRLKNRARRVLAEDAAVNIFTSTHSKEVTGLPETTSQVLLNPVDKRLQEWYDGDKDQDRVDAPFLFAGRIIEGKGVLVLADALQKLDGNRQLELVVAGEGRDEGRFRDRIQSLRTIDVTLTGRLDAGELVSLYQHVRALLVPTTTHDEGNPLVIAEALYAGTPVIASDQPPMIESVGDAGVIVEGGDAKALADAIARLDADDSYYASLREEAEARAQLFSYEGYRERLSDILPFTESVSEVSTS
ncbi:glycosyltransferase involved in cell wall biosynthesis [Salinibacter ruber]|nr:glycosyltransferase involved in cell wall biosynthesis [Salinibacter ruber]